MYIYIFSLTVSKINHNKWQIFVNWIISKLEPCKSQAQVKRVYSFKMFRCTYCCGSNAAPLSCSSF